MDRNKTALERAFELAVSGQFLTVAEIRHRLKVEGYAEAQVSGLSLTRQLKSLMRDKDQHVDQT